ncbi:MULTISPECIES: ATP synthase subunit I [Cohnella]|jgi:ATP synthase protein I|uniref:ATP synthase subunit I n=1 Tax=Cohnella TaxID=329857 RepID=UPI0003719DA8|nr:MULTISPECIES: ATP synthase subunit I [Cohnella]REK66546.1 MAG: ATP synthase subunit I [Cohnella sp.]
MDELLQKATRAAFLFLAVCFLVWAAVPEWRVYAAGAVLGVVASLVNSFLLRRRVDLIGNVYKNNPNPPRRMGLGLAGRLATVLLAAMVAYRFPDRFHLPSVLFSCFFMPVVVLLFAYLGNKRQS